MSGTAMHPLKNRDILRCCRSICSCVVVAQHKCHYSVYLAAVRPLPDTDPERFEASDPPLQLIRSWHECGHLRHLTGGCCLAYFVLLEVGHYIGKRKNFVCVCNLYVRCYFGVKEKHTNLFRQENLATTCVYVDYITSMLEGFQLDT